ncbi:hypothetical protein KAT36_00950 [Candidatus Pacearchaeota archaeon]|nr:hypothetical protein [Candidatus Pacearchaeota archaeon]
MDRGRVQVGGRRSQVAGRRSQRRGEMGKRGQFFSFLLVLITLAMCGTSVGIYMIQQEGVQSSLVSPLVVLEVRDAKDVFEMREVELIEMSLRNMQSEFGTDEFLDEFRGVFISGISDEMKNFIFSNLTWKGEVVKREDIEDVFLENVVYNEGLSRVDSNEMVFGRGKIGKSFELRALDITKTNFAVDFNFEFDREYLITREGRGFRVEAS